MRIMRNSKSVLVMGSFLVVFVGLWLVPPFGLASEEMLSGDGVVQGDPGDALGSGGLEGDPVDGLGGTATPLSGDPGDRLDIPGDPDDALDYFQVFCDPGDCVMGYEVTLFFGYFWIP